MNHISRFWGTVYGLAGAAFAIISTVVISLIINGNHP